MFTVELKINGMLIGVIYGHNEGAARDPDDASFYDPDLCLYTYSYFHCSDGRTVKGTITHRRSEGLEILASRILAKAAETEDEQRAS